MKLVLSLLILIQTFGFQAKAQSDDSSTTTQNVSEDPVFSQSSQSVMTAPRAKKKKSEATPSNYEYSVGGEYQILTNLASQVSPQAYMQSFDLRADLYIYKTFSLGIDAGIKYESIGSTVSQDSIEPTDILLKLRYGHRFSPILKLNLDLMTSLPTSDDAKVNGYQAVETGSGCLDTRIVKGAYNIDNCLAAGYIFNRYEYSPGTTAINPNYFAEYELINIVRLAHNLSFDVIFGARVTHTLDDVSTLHYANTEALDFKYHGWALNLFYTNGSYLDQSNVDLWYIDKYRQIVGFGIKYEI